MKSLLIQQRLYQVTEKEKSSYYHLYQDILHVSHGPYAKLMSAKQANRFIKSFWYSLKYLVKLLKDIILYRGKFILGPPLENDKIWLLVGSKNNRDSLTFLQDQLENTQMVVTNKEAMKLGACPRLSFHSAFWGFWRFFPLFRNLYPVFGRILWYKMDIFTETVGLYEASITILKQGKPKALIFSNDHSPHMRALLWAARKLSIPTIYLQHASVSTFFPPLRFDLNLLEGMDSLEKYKACGTIEGNVELIGMPKFDQYLSYRNHNKQIERVGICVSLIDETNLIEELILQLIASFPHIQFSFRPHPREERTFKLPRNVLISDSKKENIFNFLTAQDLIIAGDTSTHLEAVLLNVVSLYYPFNSRLSDYYGYVRNGLIKPFDTPNDIETYLKDIQKSKPDVYLQAQHYNAVAGTPMDGHSSELAVEAIKKLLYIN